jgi:amidase
MSDLAFAGLARQAELVRAGEVSSRELVELALERIERHNPSLDAFNAVYAEAALREAEAPRPGPLCGVPVAVKDELDIGGEVTSLGTGAIVERAARDSEVVRRLRAAGAIVIGKTTMPELGLWPFTESITWGITRNPWDTDRTPGGSSGGSAAAVAAGLVPAAVAADGAGSIRIPAACCGLFGLKPQRDRVPRTPHDADGSHWICFGGLTRTVADAVLMYSVLAPELELPPRRRLRVAYSERFPAGAQGRLTRETKAALRSTAELLREFGHEVVERDPDYRFSDTAVIVGLMFRGIRNIVGEIERPQRLERRTRHIARPGALVSDALLERLLRAERRMAERIMRLWDDHDVLLMPMLAAPAAPAGLMEGRGATATYIWQSTWAPFGVLWNSTGQPAASVPAGFTEHGLPLAVQLVGRPHGEGELLALAAEIEAARPWADRRPSTFA